MRKLTLIWCLLFISLTCVTEAQVYHTKSRRAVKRFEEAREAYARADATEAEVALLKAIRTDPGFMEAYQMLAQICYEQGRLEEAIEHYSTSVELEPEANPEAYRLLAGLYLRGGQYREAMRSIQDYLGLPVEVTRQREAALLLKEKCRFALHALEHPVPFRPENLGDAVNSDRHEYWPVLSVDGEVLMFTVLLPRDTNQAGDIRNLQEDFYVSEFRDGEWEKRANAGSPLNTADNEGAHSLTADGQNIFFTACNRRDGKGRCDIYYSRKENGRWSRPRNLGAPVNSAFSEKHPSVSADGRVLFFSSDRPGGKGSYDLWKSELSEKGWSIPSNLGDSVNTAGLEQSPFIHPDQQSLYFSSSGWPGMGQGDLFLSTFRPDKSWSKAQNLGYPINTHHDEIGLSIDATGNLAFFASDRTGGGHTDIYAFELPPPVRPRPVSYLKGRVYDARNMKGLRALIQLIDLESSEAVMELQSEAESGDFLLSLPSGRDYALNVWSPGYLFYSEHFTLSQGQGFREPQRRDLPLERLEVGSSIVLHNVFFASDSSALAAQSKAELNKVLEFLKNNPSVHVEIGGHTDSTGSSAYNLRLSALRADAVVRYLVKHGVDPTRLSARGYGDSLPIASNQSAEGRAQNRRTELKIITR